MSGLKKWIDDIAPGKRKCQREQLQYTESQRIDAVLGLAYRTTCEIADEIGSSTASIHNWKERLLGREANRIMADINDGQLPDDVESLKEIAKSLKAEIKHLKMETAVWQGAAELVKKDPGINPKNLTNKEKATLIDALRDEFGLLALLNFLGIARSSYYYQHNAHLAPDKYADTRVRIIELFHENEGKYGYRPIHALLRKEEKTVSEKVVRSIMAEEHLEVRRKKNRNYSSYRGEITPAPDNIIARDFHAENPNEKWLTDLTEFSIPAGKVYLSPIVDCFDGIVISWTIGTSPNAELVNSMLKGAISTLSENENPLVHSDRGCHYRWPGWIELMNNNGLIRSMSKKGCSPDNSACEGFFGRLKLEFFYGRNWQGVTIDEFIDALDKHLHWYNEVRIKKSLGWMSPVEYRESLGYAA